jgi:hypothetical protein
MFKMRTTSKCFKEQIQGHILNGMLDRDELKSGYGIETNEDNLVRTQLMTVTNEFSSWYGPYERKMHPNRQDAFTNWLDGLPSCLSTEFEYYNVHQTVKSWYENCGETYKHQEPSDKEYTLYKNLVYREFNNLCRQNKINF